jgi:cytochrome c oxidase subunit 1
MVIIQCARGGKKATAEVWEGTHPTGLEWTLPSPAPYHSFSTAPEVK